MHCKNQSYLRFITEYKFASFRNCKRWVVQLKIFLEAGAIIKQDIYIDLLEFSKASSFDPYSDQILSKIIKPSFRSVARRKACDVGMQQIL